MSVTPGNEKLDLSWNNPADGGDSITGFVVQYKKTADTTWNSLPQLSSSTLERTISSLDNGDAYSVRVRAVNSVVVTDEEDYNWGTGTGRPRPDPSVSGVSVDEIEQTTAVATVDIADPTGEQKVVSPTLPCQFIVRGVDYSYTAIYHRHSNGVSAFEPEIRYGV